MFGLAPGIEPKAAPGEGGMGVPVRSGVAHASVCREPNHIEACLGRGIVVD